MCEKVYDKYFVRWVIPIGSLWTSCWQDIPFNGCYLLQSSFQLFWSYQCIVNIVLELFSPFFSSAFGNLYELSSDHCQSWYVGKQYKGERGRDKGRKTEEKRLSSPSRFHFSFQKNRVKYRLGKPMSSLMRQVNKALVNLQTLKIGCFWMAKEPHHSLWIINGCTSILYLFQTKYRLNSFIPSNLQIDTSWELVIHAHNILHFRECKCSI